jgi:ArsR family transcriptional regulator
MDPEVRAMTAKAKDHHQVGDAAQIYAALGHPLRLRAVMFLAGTPHGGAYVTDVVDHLRRAQSTVSHHLKVLVEAGVLSAESRGPWGWYRLVPDRLAALGEHLATFTQTTPAAAGVFV